MLKIAQDKRTIDQDGRMHVDGCRISKANVCPYLGREIPDHEQLGLDPNRVYMLYRDAAALAEAVESFDNVPLLMQHIPISADAPAQELIAGTVSNPRFEYPYLVADVSAWTREAIDAIESGEQKELSCAYRYVASMISGTSPDGVRYDGKMVGPIRANHVALVSEGRAGPDVVVADEVPRPMKRPKILAAIAALLGTAPAQEALVALDTAMDEELTAAEDAALTDEEKAAACDAAMKELGKDALSDEEKEAAYKRAAKDKKRAKDGAAPAGPVGGAPKPAQDEAAQAAAIAAAVAEATKDLIPRADAEKLAADAATAARAEGRAQALELVAAREAVSAKCGVVALDSAEAVYRFALDHCKIPHKDIPASALAALYAGVASLPIAQDSAPVKVDVRDLFPALSHIRRG